MSTPRQAMKELLAEQPRSSLELSQLLSLPEKEVLDHLAHLARAPGPGKHFHLIPAECRHCGFVFTKRDRLTRPSRFKGSVIFLTDDGGWDTLLLCLDTFILDWDSRVVNRFERESIPILRSLRF